VYYAKSCSSYHESKGRQSGDCSRQDEGVYVQKIVGLIRDNQQESRRKWMSRMFEEAGTARSNVKTNQFWQHHNKPIELWTAEVTNQKMDYIHCNPVVSGFVLEPQHWKYSSAIDYCGGKGLLEMDFV
jgi:putative transposase